MQFYDVGAVVWILRTCVWWVPDSAADRYLDELRELDRSMKHCGSGGGPLDAPPGRGPPPSEVSAPSDLLAPAV
ncbi:MULTISPECIES: hypothetical protein [Arsenicicoccus]|uniref:hypothetical protein n=1 Tax=Arsenicicoccus TaxID=267408 RepID=UPI00257C4260|nr:MULTISPECIES: hypothetical protein [Arsenicicoccus]